ncbi:receptor kinase-like protein Xa21 [Lycium barbarum]|uniref:receptor kinase-like protein Xa21 n=1 Tax=Lycium barbarum TaxID=112863 RepID=UPI00293F4E47|nr:receptor kinase-like protein Xa21 [Lycium barbarum]
MLPKSIGNLSSLQTFYAEGCNLKGHLPKEIGNLRNLSSMRLEDNNFIGIVPPTISSLKKLQHLSLGANRISGHFPIVLCELPNLSMLNLSQNQMWGSIASCLGDMTSLREIYLGPNNFTASIPSKIGNLKDAILLDLSWNQISDNIPSTLGGLHKLIQLSLAHNKIEGSIPQTFGKLVDLEALDLSYNKISSVIPKSLEELKQLDSFNVSFNRLIWTVVAPSIIIVIGITSAIIFVLMRRRGKTINAEDKWLPEVAPQRVSYYELQRATQGFDENNLLGSGSFDSVYKGILADGVIVAVKVFNVQLEGTFQTFDRECEILRNLHHRNLTKIISSCCNLDFKALVLEYMSNGSLDKLLYSRDYCLTIMQRLNIMISVAAALEYLHHDYSLPVIHCDMKPSNVLLDNDIVGRLTDFATIGYIAPGEFFYLTYNNVMD